MEITNHITKQQEVVKFFKVRDGLHFYDVNKPPINIQNDHMIGIGENFYKIKDLKQLIEEFEDSFETSEFKLGIK